MTSQKKISDCKNTPYKCKYLSYTVCSLHAKLCVKMNINSEKIIVGFSGNLLAKDEPFKFIYLHEQKYIPVKRKPGNPRPRLHSLKIGKYKK
jgi:hypothetical protein